MDDNPTNLVSLGRRYQEGGLSRALYGVVADLDEA
jgi:hypothetical protein